MKLYYGPAYETTTGAMLKLLRAYDTQSGQLATARAEFNEAVMLAIKSPSEANQARARSAALIVADCAASVRRCHEAIAEFER